MKPTLQARKDWYEALLEDVFRVAGHLPYAARRMLSLQACMESGYGTTTAAQAHNLWNLTAGPDNSKALRVYLESGGRVLREEKADLEYAPVGVIPVPQTGWWKDDKGRWKRSIAQNWRSYPTRDDGIRDYAIRWMNRKDYVEVSRALLDGDMERWVDALYRARFFTLPPVDYLEGLRRVEKEVST